MPQFEMATGGPQGYSDFMKLDTFTQAYVEALFFTEDEQLGDAGCFASLAPVTVKRIIADCEAFQLSAACAAVAHDHDPSDAGHDFWLTRNGHGAGFWDGDWPEPEGSALDAEAKKFGSVDVYVGDDGLVYFM